MADKNLVSEYSSECTYGTNYYYAESDWHLGFSDAEIEQESRFEQERSRLVDEISSNNGFLVSEAFGGTVVDTSLNSNEETLYRVSRSGEMEFGVCEEENDQISRTAIDIVNKDKISTDVKYYSADKRLLGRIQKKHPSWSVLVDDVRTINTYRFSSINTLSAIHGEVKGGKPVPHPIPHRTEVENWEIINCQETPQSRKRDFRYEVVSGHKVTFSRKTTTRTGVKANISFKGFASVGGSVDRTVDLNKVQSYDYTTRITRTYTLSANVNPGRHLKAQLIYSQTQAYIPFAGWILFGGTVTLDVRQHRHGQTLRTWTETRSIESLLNEKQRRLSVEGKVEDVSEKTISEKFYEAEADCREVKEVCFKPVEIVRS